jgi:phosphatidate cytidylyltransferase
MTLQRILTAAVLIPVVGAIVWWCPPQVLAALAALVLLLAMWEFFRLGEQCGFHAYRRWTMFCTAGIFYAQFAAGGVEQRSLGPGVELVRNAASNLISVEGVLLVFAMGAAWIGLVSRRPVAEVLPAVSVSAAALLMLALPFSYLVRLQEIEEGRKLVLFTLFLVWTGDMAAYFVGRAFGRVPMAPVLSPKKTWEGAVGNLVGSLLVALAFVRWLDADLTTLLLVAGLANIAGQAGDLIESAYKRGAGAKESGGLLPGHGGMLDRIDSLVFAAPVVWCYFGWFLRSR